MKIMTRENKIKKIEWEMSILRSLMEKDNVSEFDDCYYARRMRYYKDQLYVLNKTTIS